MGEKQKALFCYFCNLKYFIVGGWVGGGGVKQVLFKAGRNCIFCIPDFIQGWRTQGESKISPFCSLCQSREGGDSVGSRFSCVNPEMKRLSLDLRMLLKHRECTLEVGFGGLFRS